MLVIATVYRFDKVDGKLKREHIEQRHTRGEALDVAKFKAIFEGLIDDLMDRPAKPRSDDTAYVGYRFAWQPISQLNEIQKGAKEKEFFDIEIWYCQKGIRDEVIQVFKDGTIGWIDLVNETSSSLFKSRDNNDL